MEQFETKIWSVDNVDKGVPLNILQEVAKWLQQEEVIAFPTETVYGLGGNAFSEKAIQKIFAAKGRPSDNPLIVHIAKRTQLDQIVSDVPMKAKQLMDAFWPGPLTLILPKKDGVAAGVTAGLDTVAVRMPAHPIALQLIAGVNLPLAAPSANLSGKPSPTTAMHVYNDLNGRIPGIIDGGLTGVGLESTVVDCTAETFMILRPGGVTKEQIEEIIGDDVSLDPSLNGTKKAPKSPGMKYTHYAPNAPLYIVEGSLDYFLKQVKHFKEDGQQIGLLVSEELVNTLKDEGIVFSYGSQKKPTEIAQRLYEGLRFFNETEVDVILAEPVPEEGIGQAIMNRLNKAAGNHYLREVHP